MFHIKCRNRIYPYSKISRLFVPDDKVLWKIPWKDYNPPQYNSEELANKPWADKNIDKNFKPNWNSIDGPVNRKSYTGDYQIVNGLPLNPEGRTGLKGRGVLGRWGPNHGADPIVTQWKRINGLKQIHSQSKYPILQTCVIQRRDNGRWAFPGGMVDPGENIHITLKREFMEEAMNSLELKIKSEDINLNNFFSSGNRVYYGYVDDSRNTDNSWIETLAINFHDDTGEIVQKFVLAAGDDAMNVMWMDVEQDMDLHEVQMKLMAKVTEIRKAHW